MRYADFAYDHASNRHDDPARKAALDRKARNAGFSNTPDYLDHVQGHPGTQSIKGAEGRTMWVSKDAGLRGINNGSAPEKSTVHPCRNTKNALANFKSAEARDRGLDIKTLKERGPLAKAERAVEPRSAAAAKERLAKQRQLNPAQNRDAKSGKEEPTPRRKLPPPKPKPPEIPKQKSRNDRSR